MPTLPRAAAQVARCRPADIYRQYGLTVEIGCAHVTAVASVLLAFGRLASTNMRCCVFICLGQSPKHEGGTHHRNSAWI